MAAAPAPSQGKCQRRIQHTQRWLRGFTLTEVMVAMAIITILLAVAVPNYRAHVQRQQMRGAAAALQQDLRNARELSINTRTAVFASYRTGKQWCWGISRNQPCDCLAGSGPSAAGSRPACEVTRSHGSSYPDVGLDTATDAQFEPAMGQAPLHGQVAFSTQRGAHLQVDLSASGRTRLCGPDAPGSPGC
jgi:prepilin-type N-terminal cleavage/methylation domain-containing protein